MGANRTDENPLTVVIIDVSPVAWGDRDLRRTASDKQRQAQGKSSVGPLILEELLAAVQAFASAFMSLNRDSALVLVGVAGNEVAVLYPRKDHLEEFLKSRYSFVNLTDRLSFYEQNEKQFRSMIQDA